MQNYRKTSHTTYDCKYHIVWITKYRKKVMTGVVGERVRELIRGICKEHEVEIIKGHVSKDHVHLFVSVPPHLSISKLVQYLKGKSSYKLLIENKQLSKEFWGRHLWARGYFVATSGNITDEVILEYIRTQDENKSDEDFTVSDGL
jgi:putative transposase